MSRRGLTGAQAAQAVLRANGVTGVSIEYVAGKLTDHFDPRTNTIRLSASVYQSTSVASIGVAAHEAGHAVQYAVGYSPIRLRNAIVPLTQVGATAAMPLILMGLVLNFGVLIKVGIIAFALSTVFQLVTLPVEINASRRALAAIGQTHHRSASTKSSPVTRASLRPMVVLPLPMKPQSTRFFFPYFSCRRLTAILP